MEAIERNSLGYLIDNVKYEISKEWYFDEVGETEFEIPYDGYYRLEVWGAQGGSYSETTQGGYGGYSIGDILLSKNNDKKLYINVGGQGLRNSYGNKNGGYNGGGLSNNYVVTDSCSGGGASHIALQSGTLSDVGLDNKDKILIVAGGGSGAYGYYSSWWNGNSGGGFTGGFSYFQDAAGTQDSGYAFGKSNSEAIYNYNTNYSGGGGGFYGGYSYWGEKGAGGGSGYIGNNRLINKSMYCYDCLETDVPDIKTSKTNLVSSVAKEKYAKKENGFVKITYLQPKDNMVCAEMVGVSWNFTRTNKEYEFEIPCDGNYKLEVWGAQGGSQVGVRENNGSSHNDIGGYGGYSVGEVKLNKNNDKKLYINVGGQGEDATSLGVGFAGGYNGGGAGGSAYNYQTIGSGGGGGATHVALQSGLLSEIGYDNKNKILIVAGGGGGASWRGRNLISGETRGGDGGGFKASDIYSHLDDNVFCKGATQDSGYAFGLGQDGKIGFDGRGNCEGTGGGGGGFYGGFAYQHNYSGVEQDVSGAGGSGYIGNNRLKNKEMYCYDCEESEDEDTKTTNIRLTSSNPEVNQAKKGNGYARITFLG